MLYTYIDATQDHSLQNIPHMQQKLGTLMRKLLKDAIETLSKEEEVRTIIRNYNEDTVDLPFPSKHGIVSNLPVRQLLLCKSSCKKNLISKKEY